MSFCTEMQMNNMLEDQEEPVINILQVFFHRVRHGHYYSRVSSVRADTVALVWHAISETYLLEGLREPWKPLGSHIRDLDKRLSLMLCRYGFHDPPHGVKRQYL